MSVTLRPISLSDTSRIHEWAAAEPASRYQGWGPNTVAQTESFVAAAVSAWSDPAARSLTWSAVLAHEGVVGNGGLTQINPSCRELSYIVHTDFWRRGIATEIARLVTEFAFHQTTVERVQATCDPRNVGSATVLSKIGMHYEGTLRHTMLIRDGWRDSQMYSVLADEWPSDPLRLQRISSTPG